MEYCKVGVVGIGRGMMMRKFVRLSDNAKVVAICDKRGEELAEVKKSFPNEDLVTYTEYDEFLKNTEIDTVVLANYATEHAPFAIKALRAGKNVISEVLPAQTMAEAVELIETVEQTGKLYAYAENYCFMRAPFEMKRLFDEGKLGRFEYGEGEYLHNCEPIWARITYGEPTHWRNNMSAFFYCTHSVGPLLHIAGQRPKSVTGFEIPFNARMARMGAKAGAFAVEMVTLESGAVLKSIHGVGPSRNSVWYSLYGEKGEMETQRAAAGEDEYNRIYTDFDGETRQNYVPDVIKPDREGESAGHGGSDYHCLHNVFDRILGRGGDVIDVYEALDMWMVGHFAYFSVLNGGTPMEIPDLRDPAVREKYRNDRRCTDERVAGSQTIPSYSKGNPAIDDSVYEGWRKAYEEELRAKAEELRLKADEPKK